MGAETHVTRCEPKSDDEEDGDPKWVCGLYSACVSTSSLATGSKCLYTTHTQSTIEDLNNFTNLHFKIDSQKVFLVFSYFLSNVPPS